MKQLKFCRICLSADCSGKYHDLVEWNLVSAYEVLTEHKINETVPQHLCPYCCSLLQKYVEFKRKCITAQNLLHRVLITYKDQITTEILDTTRQKYKLGLPYTITQRCTVKAEPCDELDRKLDLSETERVEKPLAKKSKEILKSAKCEELRNDVKYKSDELLNKNEETSKMKCKENNVINRGQNSNVVFNVSLLPPENSDEPTKCEENCNKNDYKYVEYEDIFKDFSKICSKENCACKGKCDEPVKKKTTSEVNYMDALKYMTLGRLEQIYEETATSEPEKQVCQPNKETLCAETTHVTFFNSQDDDEDIDDFMIFQNQVLVHSRESSGKRGAAAQVGAGIKDKTTKHTQTIIANVFCRSVSPLLRTDIEPATLNQTTSPLSTLYSNTPAPLDAIIEHAAANQKSLLKQNPTTSRNIFKRKFSRKYYDFLKTHVVKKTVNGKYLIKITISNIEKNDKMTIQYVAQHYSDELLNAVEELVEKIVQKLKA